MKKLKTGRWAILLLAIILMIAILSGCGGNSNKGDKEGKTGVSKTVKIAFIGPLTGPNAMQGVGARNSFELAIKKINETGNLPFRVQVVDLDDASNPGEAASVAQKAVADQGIVAVAGHWNTPCAEATIPIFKSANMALVIYGATGPQLTKPENYPYVLRVCPNQAQENAVLADFMMDQMGVKRWAVISDTTTYGKVNTDNWKAEVQRHSGTEIVAIDEIQVGQNDFRPILSKIKSLGVDGVYFGGVLMEAALVRRQMVELGMKNVAFGAISGIVYDKFIEVAGTDAAEGIVSNYPGKNLNKTDMGRSFLESYKKAGYNEPYGAKGPYAYDAANIIVQAIKEAGFERKEVADKLSKITYDGLLGTTSFDNNGQTTNISSTIYVVQDGKFIDWEDSKYKSGERTLPGKK